MNEMNPELLNKIERFHTKLNRRDVVPHGCYRRSSIHYHLVCYINNIIGLYLSSDFETIPIFINRAYKQIKFIKGLLRDEDRKIPGYYSLVLRYMSLMAEFCLSLKSPGYLNSRIPDELLQGNIDIESV
jgi:hypothetical protein